MPVTVVGAGDTVVNNTDTVPVPTSLEGQILNKVTSFDKGEAMEALSVCGKRSAPSLRIQSPQGMKV